MYDLGTATTHTQKHQKWEAQSYLVLEQAGWHVCDLSNTSYRLLLCQPKIRGNFLPCAMLQQSNWGYSYLWKHGINLSSFRLVQATQEQIFKYNAVSFVVSILAVAYLQQLHLQLRKLQAGKWFSRTFSSDLNFAQPNLFLFLLLWVWGIPVRIKLAHSRTLPDDFLKALNFCSQSWNTSLPTTGGPKWWTLGVTDAMQCHANSSWEPT